jgi:hypothetical protein
MSKGGQMVTRQSQIRSELNMKTIAGLRGCLQVTQHALLLCFCGQFCSFFSFFDHLAGITPLSADRSGLLLGVPGGCDRCDRVGGMRWHQVSAA